MIQEIMLFGMGFIFASALRIMKVVVITVSMRGIMKKDIAEAEEGQKEFKEKGDSVELLTKQIANMAALERHIASRKILEKFNYVIW